MVTTTLRTTSCTQQPCLDEPVEDPKTDQFVECLAFENASGPLQQQLDTACAENGGGKNEPAQDGSADEVTTLCRLQHSEIGVKNIAAAPLVQILVQTLSGKTITVDADLQQTVEKLKMKLREGKGVQVDQQQLIFAGKRLTDELILGNCGVRGGSLFFLVAGLQGGHPKVWKKKKSRMKQQQVQVPRQ